LRRFAAVHVALDGRLDKDPCLGRCNSLLTTLA
jgi:hypothetical protein